MNGVFLTNPKRNHHLIPLPRLQKSQFLSIFHRSLENKTLSGVFFQRNQSLDSHQRDSYARRVIRAIFRLPQLLLHSINIQRLAQPLPQQRSVQTEPRLPAGSALQLVSLLAIFCPIHLIEVYQPPELRVFWLHQRNQQTENSSARTHHPDIGACLQLCIHPEPSKVRVHLQPS